MGASLLQAVLGFPAVAHADLITLPTGGIARLDYIGFETFHDVNGNGVVDAGDFFDGIILVTSITNASGTVDLSSQLATRELTGHFRFTVIGGSSLAGHFEFGLTAADFFQLYVGTGPTKNWDPTAADAVARATDGDLWAAVLPGVFFESVNDRLPNGATLNRAWMNLTTNNTGYDFTPEPFPTLLGLDPTHTYLGEMKGDNVVQAFFENSVAGPSTVPGFTFSIFGSVFVEANIPEPSTLALTGLGLLSLLGYAWRRQKRAG
jgi:hypothetical protein